MENVAVCGHCVYMWTLYVMCAYWYEWALLGVSGHCWVCMEIAGYVEVLFDCVVCVCDYIFVGALLYMWGYCICAHWVCGGSLLGICVCIVERGVRALLGV